MPLSQFFCCYSVTVVPPFSSLLIPTPPPSQSTPCIIRAHESSIHVPFLPLPLLSPLILVFNNLLCTAIKFYIITTIYYDYKVSLRNKIIFKLFSICKIISNSFFIKISIYLFLERGEGKEKEREYLQFF